jgi:MEDS: MEthanogen/methylotroph, DcmR Sensory domain
MASWQKALTWAEPKGHFVQFYKSDEPLLNRTVGRFLWDGLLRGDGLLVIGTAERRRCLVSQLEKLGADVDQALGDRQLLLLDAQQTLDCFMTDGQPRKNLFESTLNAALHELRPPGSGTVVRAYGEMVGILWQAGQRSSAICLEDYWNRLLQQRSDILLFCGYPIDFFGEDCDSQEFKDVLCAHTHLLPTSEKDSLEAALRRAMNELLGDKAASVRLLMSTTNDSTSSVLPPAEADVLWLRQNLPAESGRILDLARQYCEWSAAD